VTHPTPDAWVALSPIDLRSYRRIVVLTGAGISVASGLRPYRGPGGLWNAHPELLEQTTAAAFARDPMTIWRTFGSMRSAVDAAQPTLLTSRSPRPSSRSLAVGTSGSVSPAANFVRSAEYEGARTVFVNLEPLEPPNPMFHGDLPGPRRGTAAHATAGVTTRARS
jgi:NAD-dependent SIR2 family protein deacetylase